MSSLLEDRKIKDIYSEADLRLIRSDKLPRHVAIIMDGNRRWAKQHALSCILGHSKGAEVVTKIVRAASKIGIKALTVFSFSTENWTRSSYEIHALMELIKTYLQDETEAMVREGVRLDMIGDLSKFPQDVQEAFEAAKWATRNGDKIELILALNYGGRDEIVRAALRVSEEIQQGRVTKEHLTEQTFSEYLDTARWGDPELVIRTGGEMRLSNFLLWQLSYAEIYITDVFWPDFNEKEFLNALIEYQKRQRRLGG